ncbi:Apc13p-domain-containing protein [Aaosphaeria arxii CBS 175.79]|uniref:Apc13p-domain-containing protein n=1 Tax=Aaosphaeria arxii CBS 175.79 TaxID=1450172 RepID=A0A6A5XEN2_9PLEO|nr:Apc13p-domain-containing protein [Aaosphaeria arxii CBS 175.79]KAF2011370.1 Apc13p-domain-containing protein [Aaosphaeria arxii CBS 175.79]
MSRDSTFTYFHMHQSHHADLLESFTNPTNSHIPPEEIYIPPQHQPVNPEDEDDVVPDQHAAFGIQRATQGRKESQWKDLGLEELLRQGERALGGVAGRSGTVGGASASGVGPTGAGGAGVRRVGQRRRDESVRVALQRRPGAGVADFGFGTGGDAAQSSGGGGGGAGNGLPR